MEIKAVKFRRDGFYTQPFVFGGDILLNSLKVFNKSLAI